jgi:hypothetical protein
MADFYAIQAANARAQYQNLGGGKIAHDMETMRAHGIGASHPIVQDQLAKVQRVLVAVQRSTEDFARRGTGTPEIKDQLAKAHGDAVAEWDSFVAGVLALDKWGVANFGTNRVRPPQTLAEMEAHNTKINAENRAREQAQRDAEQVIVDAVNHVITTVEEAGGYLVVITDVQTDGSWGATAVSVNKSVQIVGVNVAALPEDVKSAIRTHGKRIAAELLNRQRAALEPTTPALAA